MSTLTYTQPAAALAGRCAALFLLLWMFTLPPAAAQEPDAAVEAEAAEEAATDDELPLGAWDLGLTGRLNAAQAAYNNWQEGGLNTITLAAGVAGDAERETTDWIQDYDLRLAYGFIAQDSIGYRKADDVIRLEAGLQYKGRGFFEKFRPTAGFSMRTQFAPGYNYDEVPPELIGIDPPPPLQPPVKVSDFFAPAVFTQTLGLTYEPADWFTQRFGFAAKETAIAIRRLRPLYGNARGEALRFEAGLEARSELERELFENVVLESGLSLFAAFNNPDSPDARWENLVTMKVNDWLGVNFEFVTLYDRDISEDLQLREVLSLGVTVVVL